MIEIINTLTPGELRSLIAVACLLVICIAAPVGDVGGPHDMDLSDMDDF